MEAPNDQATVAPTPAAPGAPEPAAAVPPPAAPAAQPEDAAPERLSLTQKQLDERLDRGFNAKLTKLFGTNDPTQIKALMTEAETLKQEAEERRKAEMSEVERANTEKAALEQQMSELRQQHEDMVWQRDLQRECLQLGIKDSAYADFRIREAAASVPDGEDFDVSAFLAKDIAERPAQYGAVTKERVPAQTAPGAASAPAPNQNPDAGSNALEMTPEERRKAMASWG